jgi:hypothetical protein
MRGHKYVFSYVLSSYFVKRSSCSIFCYYISFFIFMLFLCIVIMIFVFFKLAAIISLISLEWQHPQVASLTPPLLLRCLCQVRKMRGHVFVLGVDIASFYDCLLYFTTVLTLWYFRTVLTVWYFRTVLTVWYCRTVLTVWYCRTVLTVWYFRTVLTVVF